MEISDQKKGGKARAVTSVLAPRILLILANVYKVLQFPSLQNLFETFDEHFFASS